MWSGTHTFDRYIIYDILLLLIIKGLFAPKYKKMEPETKQDSTTPSFTTNYATPIAIVIAGVIIAGAMFFSDGKKPVAPVNNTSNNNQATAIDIKNVNTDGAPFIGNPNAPVIIAQWFDYQCPACKYGDQNMITPLVSEYVKTGKLKIVFKDFAFLGPDSQSIALTARAVWEAYPDKFYEWHKTFFDNQGQENTGWATKEVITALTKKVAGIDTKIIDGLLAKNSAKYQAAIDADKEEGAKFGINATPSFLIGDKVLAGVPAYATVKTMIDALLVK